MFSEELVEFVKRWEGLKLVPSEDRLVPGVWDVGYGKVLRTPERPTITREQADAWLRDDLTVISADIDDALQVQVAQHEFDALLSLAYNVGTNAVLKSTLFRYVNNCDWDKAADEFMRWNRANGRIVAGLVKRREAEQAMFLYADYSGAP